MEKLPKHPWLWSRNGTWYLRAKVPADLRGIYPRAEVKCSLDTRDLREASRRIHEPAARVQRLFDDYRKHQGPPPKPSKIVRNAKRFVPRYDGTGQPPEDLKSSEELTDVVIQTLSARHWGKKFSWVAESVISLTHNERRERADLYDVEASQLASGDDDTWDTMFRETANLLEEAGYYFKAKSQMLLGSAN